MASPEGWAHFRGSAKGWLTLRRLRRVRFWRSDRPARLPFLILFAVEFPVKHGQDGDHGDQLPMPPAKMETPTGLQNELPSMIMGITPTAVVAVVRKMGVMRRAPAS